MTIHEQIDYPEREVKSGATQTQFSGNLTSSNVIRYSPEKIFNLEHLSAPLDQVAATCKLWGLERNYSLKCKIESNRIDRKYSLHRQMERKIPFADSLALTIPCSGARPRCRACIQSPAAS